MKKIYLLTLSVFVSTSIFAQQNVSTVNAANAVMTIATEEVIAIPESGNNRAPFDVIWSQDFGSTAIGGIPTGWSQAGINQVWKKTMIGKNVSIGSNATILPVEICDNVVIGAGSVVTKNITKSGIYAGNPARFIRNI